MNYLIKIFIITIFISLKLSANENENKILFKINNKVVTNVDFERRINYLQTINNLDYSNLDKIEKNFILQDFISSLIFYEYNLKNSIIKQNLTDEINNIYNQKVNFELGANRENNLRDNLKIDLIRKKILENLINNRKNDLNKKTDILDLLYNYNLNYVIFKNDPLLTFKIESVINRNDFLKFISFLKENKIDFILKNEDINDINKISNNLKENLKNNNKIFKNINESYITLYSLEKNLESYEGVFVKLINFTSNNELQKEQLSCNFINKFDKKIEFKEYEYSKLNKIR